ncbi:hypothetical protein ASZ78_013679 [Callipepla squamata]|uniref:TUG ubiquitin-like domain-containing protein n=1 Tax=Callipepla squamata TaxID=9009 RepID=A0A226N0L4_CALSU|nr:hypothetical protein ASZ78_013679 [Callipepla squamata]
MAAAGGGGAAVSVLAPSGRRVTVRVGPGTVLLQILEEVCRKQGGSPAEYGLKFQRSILDLTLQWRFARLPNNAKLEMVPVSCNRVGTENTVRIALQLDDGSRLQDTFLCQQTLWELLNHFAKTREFVEQGGEFCPVCIYMRDEISGKDALEKTTLKSLGLTGGSAIVRVVMKKCGLSVQEEAVDTTAQCDEPVVMPSSTEGAVDVSLPQTQTFPTVLDHGAAALSLNSCKDEQDSIREPNASLEELCPPSESKSTPFVPFFGGGQRLGNSSVSAPPPELDMPSLELPTTFSSPGGPSKPKKSKNSQELQKEQEQLVEREPLLCHPDLLEPLPADLEDLPDEFFEVTVDDVRKRLAQLQSERQVPFLLVMSLLRILLLSVVTLWPCCWLLFLGGDSLLSSRVSRKRLEDAPLLTKSLREAQLKEKIGRYPKVSFVLFLILLASPDLGLTVTLNQMRTAGSSAA